MTANDRLTDEQVEHYLQEAYTENSDADVLVTINHRVKLLAEDDLRLRKELQELRKGCLRELSEGDVECLVCGRIWGAGHTATHQPWCPLGTTKEGDDA